MKEEIRDAMILKGWKFHNFNDVYKYHKNTADFTAKSIDDGSYKIYNNAEDLKCMCEFVSDVMDVIDNFDNNNKRIKIIDDTLDDLLQDCENDLFEYEDIEDEKAKMIYNNVKLFVLKLKDKLKEM